MSDDKYDSAKMAECLAECLAEKEGGHNEIYLTWVHQGDGTCYWKCDYCGWIKPDSWSYK